MTVVKVQTMLMDGMVKASAGKGDCISETQKSGKKDGQFSDIMAMQSNQLPATDGNIDNSGVKQSSSDKKVEPSTPNTTKTVSSTDDKSVTENSVEEEIVTEQKPDASPITDQSPKTEEFDQEVGLEEGVLVDMQNFLQELQKILGITQKELDQLMEESGLTAGDLLNPQNLQALILNQFNADNVGDALVNEPLANALQEGMKALDQLKEDIGQLVMKDSDQITPELVTKMLSDNNVKVISGQQKSVEEVRPLDEKEEVVAAPSEKEVTVIVEHETPAFKNETEGRSLERHESKAEAPRQSDTKVDFVDYFASRVNQTGVENLNQTSEPISVRSIVTQIVDQIKVTISQSQTSMQLLLNPENLGHVELMVAHKEGVMTAHFTVENQVTKEALESSLNILKENFAEQGIKVSDVEVTIGNYSDGFSRDEGNGQADNQNNSNRRTSFRGLDYGEETDDLTLPQAENTNYNGTVDYTA